MTVYYKRSYLTSGGDPHTAAWMADSEQDFGCEYHLKDALAVYSYPDEGRWSVVTYSSVVVHKTDDLHKMDEHEFREFLGDVFLVIARKCLAIGGPWGDEQ